MFSRLVNVQTVDTRCTLVGFDPPPRSLQVLSRKGALQQPLPCAFGITLRAQCLVADGTAHGFTAHRLRPPRLWAGF
ncbi:MAG: hypothetical protein ACRERW_17145 [Pseudomonas sp.]